MTVARITRARTKQGDNGYSNLVSGLKMRKSNSICSLQNNIQLLSNSLRFFINYSENYNQLDLDDKHFITNLVNKLLNNLSASIYFSFENKDYLLDSFTLNLLEERIENLQKKVGETREFIIAEKDLLYLEQALIYTRQVEHLFWVVVDQNNFYNLTQIKDRQEVVNSTSIFLNSLSDYLFLLIRYLSTEVKYWDK